MRMRRSSPHRYVRRAVVVVEMAVVTPILILMTLGIFELGYSLMVRHTVATAAREAAREASLPDVTLSDVQGKVDRAMAAAGLSGYTTTTNLTTLAANEDEVWVRVAIPFNQAALTGPPLVPWLSSGLHDSRKAGRGIRSLRLRR